MNEHDTLVKARVIPVMVTSCRTKATAAIKATDPASLIRLLGHKMMNSRKAVEQVLVSVTLADDKKASESREGRDHSTEVGQVLARFLHEQARARIVEPRR